MSTGDGGWLAGDGGAVLCTTDGGASRISQAPGSGNFLMGVAAADATHAWVVGQDAAVLATRRPGSRLTNASLTTGFACKLAKGTYHSFAYATDAADNGQSAVGSARLVVK